MHESEASTAREHSFWLLRTCALMFKSICKITVILWVFVVNLNLQQDSLLELQHLWKANYFTSCSYRQFKTAWKICWIFWKTLINKSFSNATDHYFYHICRLCISPYSSSAFWTPSYLLYYLVTYIPLPV